MDAIVFITTYAAAYLIGAVPFGYLVARSRGVDIFAQGSGNIGATNVGRVLGRRLGILVFWLDFAKGALVAGLAVAVKRLALTDTDNPYLTRGYLEVGAGLCAFLGHLFPVYLRFRGGKGVATGAGVVFVLMPVAALAAVFAWLVVVLATRFVSLASCAAAIVLGIVQLTVAPNLADPRTSFGCLAALLVIVRHRANISRLLQGTENQLKESLAMNQLTKVLHLFALALWFGMGVFFTFVVALSLFNTFEAVGQLPAEQRPAWFPLADAFQRSDDVVNGPREQGSRVAGTAVSFIFPVYYLVQGLCGLVALATALPWSRRQPPQKVHRLRVSLLILAMIGVLVGWGVEGKVSALRPHRNHAMDAYLQTSMPTQAQMDELKSARAEFGLWHTASLLLNVITLVLVSAAVVLAAWLPASVPASTETMPNTVAAGPLDIKKNYGTLNPFPAHVPPRFDTLKPGEELPES